MQLYHNLLLVNYQNGQNEKLRVTMIEPILNSKHLCHMKLTSTLKYNILK